MEKKRGPFESLGKKIDSFVGKSLDVLLLENQEDADVMQKDISPEEVVVKAFKNGIGNDVEFHRANANFTYKDILSWAHEHRVGDELYLIRYNDMTYNNTWVCVCFAQEGKPLTSPNYAKICYVFKELPESLSNIFGGKNMYVQPLKK